MAAEAYWRRWRPGRIEAIRPAFRVLGRPAAFAYEALGAVEMSTKEVETAGLLARRSAYQALATLAEHGLAERGPGGGWVRGQADLNDVAERVGAGELAAAHLARIRGQRDTWHDWLGIAAALADADPDPQAPADIVDGIEDQALADRPPKASPAVAADVPDQRRPATTAPRTRRSDRRRAPDWLRPPPRRRPMIRTRYSAVALLANPLAVGMLNLDGQSPSGRPGLGRHVSGCHTASAGSSPSIPNSASTERSN